MSAVRTDNGDLDQAKAHWLEVRTTLEDSAGGANPNKFILHWWLSRSEYTAERKLFRLIRRRVTPERATNALASLREDARLYARIANPSAWTASRHQRPLKDSLTALNVFGVQQPRPLILALLRALERRDIQLARAKKTLTAIENFHFATTAIVGVSSTGGISEMYAKHARELTAAPNSTARTATLSQLVSKLAHRMPNRETFVSQFVELRYSRDESSQRRLIAYTLRRLHDHVRSGVPFDHEVCSIEHLSSQSDLEEWMPTIGNLLWVSETLNQRLGNKSFETKQSILEDFSTIYDIEDVLEASTWTSEEVEARARRLAGLAYDNVWKIRTG